MNDAFTNAKSLIDKRVRLHFADDHQVIARLLYATEDLDGSLHLIYDHVVWTNDPSHLIHPDGVFHASGEMLLKITEEKAGT